MSDLSAKDPSSQTPGTMNPTEVQHPPAMIAPGAKNYNLLRLPSWIEIVLIGADDKPIPKEKYRITLANGEVREGVLDENGRARLETISRGDCKIAFPDLDSDAWDEL